MKNQNRISQLMLELYHRGLANNKERKLVEKALVADSEVRQRYEELKKSDREIRRLVTQELKRQNIPQTPPAPPLRKKRAAMLLIAAAAVLLCALIPALLYLRSDSSKKDNVIAEETIEEVNLEDEKDFVEIEPNIEVAIHPEHNSGVRIEIVENHHVDPDRITEPEYRIDPESGISVAVMPEPDTGIRFRGEGPNGNQPDTVTVPEEPSNLNIPPGITFIFDNMFANKGLAFVIIPVRITSIGNSAFSGNPLLSVTIGANVFIEDNAIPGNFAVFYNENAKAAGTYTRKDVNSEVWEKR